MGLILKTGFILFSYLLGAIPFGYLLTRHFYGKNILEMGSGNVGSTNVGRVAGRTPAIITQLLDMLKGFVPVALYFSFAGYEWAESDFYVFGLALAAILGHDFSLFLKFRGGKGVNTTLGASLLIVPFSVLISVAVYFLVKWRFKYVSLGSIILSVALPVSEMLMNGFSSTVCYLAVCMVLIIFRHRTNIKRLIDHQEILGSVVVVMSIVLLWG